jgi:hypothetical protein
MKRIGTSRNHFFRYLTRTVCATIAAATLASTAFAQPSNDNFADAPLISGTSASGTNVGATRESGEPTSVNWPGHDRSALGGKSVWWKWIAPNSGLFTIKTGDKSGHLPSSNFDTQLGVYTGTSVENLTEVASNESDPNFPPGLSKVDIKATAGTTYYILVDGFEGAEGNVELYVVPTRYTLSIFVTPFELGSVLVDPQPPTDGYLAGTRVTLRALPETESAVFYGWSGGAIGSTNPVTIVMNSDKSVTAHFSFNGKIFWQRTNNVIGAWFLDNTNMLSAEILGQTTPSWTAIGIGDFDENGENDIVFRNLDGRVGFWMMQGASRINSAVLDSGTNWQAVAVADLNHDNKPDIIFQNKDGRIAARLMDNLNQIGSATIGKVVNGWKLVATGDLNVDGNVDLFFQKPDGSLAVWLMDGTKKSNAALLPAAGPGWNLIAARDLDDNGTADLIFQNAEKICAAWLMNGTERQGSVVFREGSAITRWRGFAAQ